MRLLIGNKNYSSWSLRAWLLLKQAGIRFEEQALSFNDPAFHAKVRRVSPVGKVPVLVDGLHVVWDSLAIAEYLAERFPELELWPADQATRARARSICAEMHSGFANLRGYLPMNIELRLSGMVLPVAVQRDIDRMVEIWTDCRTRFGEGGPFLFGRFTAADAYFAPVALRFVTYDVKLPEVAARYVETLLALPALQEWIDAALQEHDWVEVDELYRTKPG